MDFWLDAESTTEDRRAGIPRGTLSISGFTCLVGIAVNDQLNDGDGQVGLLKGAHHPIEAHFKVQWSSGARAAGLGQRGQGSGARAAGPGQRGQGSGARAAGYSIGARAVGAKQRAIASRH